MPFSIVQALPAVLRLFWDITMAVVLHTTLDAAVEDAQVGRALYMCAWHARKHEDHIRAREHAYASPRRSPRLAERRV